MGKVVAGIGISHAPGALGFPESAHPDVRASFEESSRAVGATLTKEQPDLLIAILDDHFENFFRNTMPALSICVGDTHSGPADHAMEGLRVKEKFVFDGAPDIAEEILKSVVDQGFDITRTGPVEFGNNFVVPWVLMEADVKCKLVPVYINVFTPPLVRYNRAYDFGAALRRAVETATPPDYKVAFLATGGLSHWPPTWRPGVDENDKFLARMKKFQTLGHSYIKTDPNLKVDLNIYEMEMAATNDFPKTSKHPLVNEEWDREFLDHFVKGDVKYMKELEYKDVEEKAGHGGHEVLNWVALMGALGGQPSKLLMYEAVIEWICGMAVVDYAK